MCWAYTPLFWDTPWRWHPGAETCRSLIFFFYWRYNPLWVFVFCSPLKGLEPPCIRGFLITHNEAPQSVGLLRTSDQSVAETCTWQHTTLTTDKHPCPGGIRTYDRSSRSLILVINYILLIINNNFLLIRWF